MSSEYVGVFGYPKKADNLLGEGDLKMYDHYIALDWAQSNMAIARMTRESHEAKVLNVTSDLKELQNYLKRLKGRKILTLEETTTSQWLYVELKNEVDELVICDPYRNHLLGEGAKTDRLDAVKLVQLLRAGLLKPVFHSGDELLGLRKLVSGYEDVIKAGVRLKNQRAALFRGRGKDARQKDLKEEIEKFVLKGLDQGIASYEAEKKRYEEEFWRLRKKHGMIGKLDEIYGIGLIGAVKVTARVVDPRRFKNKGQWLSYCGLIRHEKLSGGRSYGWRGPRYCRAMKSVFKTAAMSVITSERENPFKDYYRFLIDKKRYADHVARHALARRIAVISLGVLKSNQSFNPARLKKE